MVLLQTQLDTPTINFESGAIDAKKRPILRACGGGGSNNPEFPGEQGELCLRQKSEFDRGHSRALWKSCALCLQKWFS